MMALAWLVVYTAYLRDRYHLDRAESFFEIPLASGRALVALAMPTEALIPAMTLKRSNTTPGD
jgi:hypothetical protein